MTLLLIVILVSQARQLDFFLSHLEEEGAVQAQTEASASHPAKFLISVTGNHISLGKMSQIPWDKLEKEKEMVS